MRSTGGGESREAAPGHAKSAVTGGTGLRGAGSGETGSGETGTRLGRRRVVVGGWVAGVGIGFAVYLRLASTRAVNSDGAAQALQAWDMLHGNLLLRGWTTSDVSFYTTELPQYLLIEAVRGLGQDVVHIAAAMTYTLVVAAAALVAAGRARGGYAVTRGAVAVGIMLAPQLGSGTNVLLSSPDHIGTSVPLLLAWLTLDRGRRGWRVPLVTSVLLAWAAVADSIVLMAGIIPLALVCALRVARTLRASRPRAGGARASWPGASQPEMNQPTVNWPAANQPGANWPAANWPGANWCEDGWYEVVLGSGAVVAAGVADLALRAIHAVGGFSVRPLGVQVVSVGEILRHNLPVVGQCLLLLPGADFLGLGGGFSTFFVFLHLIGAWLAGAGIVLAARRVGRLDLVSQVLLAAIAVDLAGFAVTNRVYAVSSAREIAPVLPFAAALAGRLLGGPLLRTASAGLRSGGDLRSVGSRWGRGARLAVLVAGCVVGAGYLAGLGLELGGRAAPAQDARLTAWLEGHQLGTGLSGYWEASVVTLASGERVAVRPVSVAGGRVVPALGEVRSDWFRAGASAARCAPAQCARASYTAAHFVVLFPGIAGYPGFADQGAVTATFGRPDRVYHVGRYQVWYWRANLLSRISH